jgi:DNA-binding NtrC family response regulator
VKSRVLIVDDEPSWVALLSRALLRHDLTSVEVGRGQEAIEAVRDGFDGVVALDRCLPDGDGLAIIEPLLRLRPDLRVVLMTTDGDDRAARLGEERGACRFVSKSEGLARVVSVLCEALRAPPRNPEAPPLRPLVDERFRFGRILTRSARMQRVFDTLAQVVDSRVTVLLQGESGTGKELVARALHHESHRRAEAFVAVNCAGIPEALLESELFGHERGAFTGAVATKKGKFEQADGGTLFLDEIGEMPLHLQAKLLRVLQERQVERVGSISPRPVDVRVISATHRDLGEMVRARRFREDLYYRLAVFPVVLPPLRDRDGDVAMLARHFLARYCAEEGKAPMSLTPDALSALERHAFPGNVRELENIISRAVLLASSDQIGLADLPDDILSASEEAGTGSASPTAARSPSASAWTTASERLEGGLAMARRVQGHLLPMSPAIVLEAAVGRTLEAFTRWLREHCVSLDEVPTLDALEEIVVRRALALADGQVGRAAQALGLSRATLYRRLRTPEPAASTEPGVDFQPDQGVLARATPPAPGPRRSRPAEEPSA